MINIQNIDVNECFKYCLVKQLHFTDHHLERIRKVGKDFPREIDFKDIKFPLKIRAIPKKDCISISVFVVKTRKNIESMCKKKTVQKDMLIYY